MRIIHTPTLDRFRNATRCEWCRTILRGGAAPHHIHTRGASRLDISINLISLGFGAGCHCHQSHHDGNEPRTEQLLERVAAREQCEPDYIREAVWFLRRIPKNTPPETLSTMLESVPAFVAKLVARSLRDTVMPDFSL